MSRFFLGGALVSLFAAIATAFKPKTFAGLFGSAPTIALVSLGIAFHEQGPEHAGQLSVSMAIGAVGLFACARPSRSNTSYALRLSP
ncbi:MAG TPA: DUF3147 family protein [Polyangiaceae bacterium]|jgi:uncharacterized membrane protein (GlpM family)|nr:DUF3147 family protein [Polyangiaceae bacterium]